ncbi:MAG TPA: patatin-like phospholipase family protein [Acetobacteraceae bacterium]|nr:patatin-like phospholipase family protein [Acetobacteraceae bacterium]
MDSSVSPASRPPIVPSRPSRCDMVALVLQGGGALSAYQADVYQAIHEAGLEPDWVSGVSIGVVNAAIIAGNPPERASARVLGDGGDPQRLGIHAERRLRAQAAQRSVVLPDARARRERTVQGQHARPLVFDARRNSGDRVLRQHAAPRDAAPPHRLRPDQHRCHAARGRRGESRAATSRISTGPTKSSGRIT